MMREHDVRQALYESEIRRLLANDSQSMVIDELGVMEGKYRIDVAVIGEQLHGYEIKSASDNLERLPAQQESYSKIFDRMTLVADERHVAEALKIIPPWWGLIAVSMRDGKPYLNEIWPSRLNLTVDPHFLSQLLWREEALKILSDLGLAHGVRSKSRKLMWKLLSAVLDLKELRAAVSLTLRSRTTWRLSTPARPSRPKRRRRKRRSGVYSGRSSGKSLRRT
jgi:hypothetical protein